MLDYIIKHDDNKIYIAEDNNYLSFDITIQKYLNKILISKLNNLSTLENVTKRLLDFKSKIPLYINRDILLMCLISYRIEGSVYINYFSISKYTKTKNKLIIYFYSGHCYICNSTHTFYSQLEKCLSILEIINL